MFFPFSITHETEVTLYCTLAGVTWSGIKTHLKGRKSIQLELDASVFAQFYIQPYCCLLKQLTIRIVELLVLRFSFASQMFCSVKVTAISAKCGSGVGFATERRCGCDSSDQKTNGKFIALNEVFTSQ